MVARAGPVLLVSIALLLLGARAARAHGGNFRLGDPTPSAPPGWAPPPSTTPGTGGQPSLTPTGQPNATGTGRRTRDRSTPDLYNWLSWWLVNGDGLLPRRHPELSVSVPTVTPSESGGLPPELEARVQWQRRLDETAARVAVPFLLDLLRTDRSASDELVGAALIAVARIAKGDAAVDVLRRFAFDPKAGAEVRECAIVGMGFQRRTRGSDQLPVAEIQHLRHDLLSLFDDERLPTRSRAFAMYALALLADQPYPDGPMQRYGRDLSREIFLRLRARYAAEDLPVALLTALGRQPPEGVPSEVVDDLRVIALRGRGLGRSWDTVLRSHVLSTLVGLRVPDAGRIALNVFAAAREPEVLQASAAIALTALASRIDAPARAGIASNLRRALPRQHRERAFQLGLLALGTLLGEDLADDSEAILSSAHADSFLLERLRWGNSQERPFAALALGIAAAHAHPTSRPVLVFLTQARRALAKGLVDARGPDDVVAAYAIACGLAHAEEAEETLLDDVHDTNAAPVLRGQAAVALAALRLADADVEKALLDLARERIHPYVHVEAVRALSILGAHGAVEDLLVQLEDRSSPSALLVVATALGRLGHPAATERLIALARDPKSLEAARVAAVVALGLLFDREEPPSRVRLNLYADYVALTESLARWIDIL